MLAGWIFAGGCGHEDAFVKIIEGEKQTPDSTFGTNGSVTGTDASVTVTQILKDKEGNILIGGCNDTKGLSALWRYNSIGVLDSTFATNGEFLTDESNCICTISMDSANRIILVDGYKIWRLLSDGSPDVTFGNNGILDTQTLLELKSNPLELAEDYLRLSYIENFLFNKPTFVIDQNDNIYFVAKDEIWQIKNGENKFFRYATGLGYIHKMEINNINQLVLLAENGSIKIFDIDSNSVLMEVLTIDTGNEYDYLFTTDQADNSVVYSRTPGYPLLFSLTRWRGDDGSLDPSFGSAGGTAYWQLNYFAFLTADLLMVPDIKIDKNGNIYVLAMTIGHKMMAFKYDSNGNLDTSFGDEGVVSYPVHSKFIDNYVFTMDEDGHFYFAKTDGKLQLWKF